LFRVDIASAQQIFGLGKVVEMQKLKGVKNLFIWVENLVFPSKHKIHAFQSHLILPEIVFLSTILP